ncbi:hypothetical protein HD554DRAFT_2329523 [Boletus coccyginus]|nr:hypothetical protein HD554DRAFT_2329523 [Boletus coccyginus]
MVDIYLNLPEVLQDPFLSIPNSDVRRLSKRPFKWLRFVMFSICGARGDLSATPDGPPVDYDSESDKTSFFDAYYYNPSGNCIFVDYAGLNDKVTSSSQTPRRSDFRDDVGRRDGGVCVITGAAGEHCEAAHLIPESKGDEYMDRVVSDRSSLYRSSPSISGINDVQNGVFLNKEVHSRLGHGWAAFIKTPNYGLEPGDICRYGDDSAGTDHVTLQQLKCERDNPAKLQVFTNSGIAGPALAFTVGAHVDARFQGDQLPPAIILDYMYGIAAYKRWGGGGDDADPAMKSYHHKHYEDIPPRPPDDPKDKSYSPSGSRQRKPQEDEMARAVDKVNFVLMSLHGITPQEAVNRREKRAMEEEMKAQEASRSKVMEWMNTTAVEQPL